MGLRSRVVATFTAITLLGAAAGSAHAQSEADVVGARKLFAEAVKDEEKRDFEIALAKFKKVQSVRDTAGVRYHVAVCLDGLGRFAEASAAYKFAVELVGEDASQKDIKTAAEEKLAELDRRRPRLTVTVSSKAPADAEVKVDDRVLSSTEIGQPLAVDPGSHRVTGRAAGAAPFSTEVSLPEGARFSIAVPLDPAGAHGAAEAAPETSKSQTKTIGWILVGSGAALVAGSAVTWAIRQSAIGSIEDDCPGNRCPESKRADVTSAQDRAKAMVPLTIALGGVGLAAAVTGLVLIARSPDPGSASPAPHAEAASRVRVRFAPARDGATLSLSGNF